MSAVEAATTMLFIALPVMFAVIAVFIGFTVGLKKLFPGKEEA